MRDIPTTLIFLLLSFLTALSHSYGYVASTKKTGYLEVGFGVTQFDFVDKYLSDYKIAPSPNMKIVFGGRVGRSQHAWFEIGYAYNGAFKTEDTTAVNDKITTYRSQSISIGFKFTTKPYRQVAAYARAGGGRFMLETRAETFTVNTSNQITNDYNTSLTNHFYAGIGINFALGRNALLGIETQQMRYSFEDTSFSDNSIIMTFTRYFK